MKLRGKACIFVTEASWQRVLVRVANAGGRVAVQAVRSVGLRQEQGAGSSALSLPGVRRRGASRDAVSCETGVGVATLEHWRAGLWLLPLCAAGWQQPTLDRGGQPGGGDNHSRYDPTRIAWCRGQGSYPAALGARKRDAIGGFGESRGAKRQYP